MPRQDPTVFVFLDTPFDRAFPVYTRANAGEILPDPVSPLAWSIIGPGLEDGFRTTFCDDFGLLPRPGLDTPYLLVGRIVGRFHINLSAIRVAADRLPGTSAATIDVQYFGDATSSGLPDHDIHPDDRRYRIKAPPSMGRTLAGIGRRVDRDRARIDDLVCAVGAAAEADDADLIRLLRRGMAEFGEVLGTHVTARTLTSPLLEQALGALARAGVEPEDSLRYVASIPDLESAKPSRRLMDIARIVPAGSDLAALVADGSYAALAASALPRAREVADGLAEFLDDFGHRGVGEFDPTNPTWRQRPDDVVALLSRMHERPAEPDDAPDVDPGRVARPLVAAARSAMARAERTKDTCMRATDALRCLLERLGSRWAGAIDEQRLHMCTVEELEAHAHGSDLPATVELDRRRTAFDHACETAVAEWSDGDVRLPDATTPPAHVSSLAGIAGSPGVVRGRARILTDPYGDIDDGDVLVAAMTDTAWSPLFMAAGAIVTDVGGVLSHATIIARELGVPAVVNTKTGTRDISTGDFVEVDGGTGRVTILERG